MKHIRLLKDLPDVDVCTFFKIEDKFYEVICLTYQDKGKLCRINPRRSCNKPYVTLDKEDYSVVVNYRRYKKA
jgi:hypothetical protein